MTIATYISDLLYRYECVILPGFGAFLSQKVSAEFNEKEQNYYPPKKQLSFNSQLNKNDGLLANYIAEVEGVGYRQAIYKVEEYVQQLQLQLENDKNFTINNIGSFQLSNEGKLQFEPLINSNFLADAFGLSAIPAISVSREELKKQVEELEAKTPILFTPERRRASSYLKYAAIGIFAIGLTGFTGLKIYSNQVTDHNIAEQQAAESQLQQKIQEATFVIDNPLPEITFTVTKQSGDFHVVAGAFRVEENAHQRVKELQAEGHKARYIGENKYGLHQVVYSSYQTRREAINALYAVQRTNAGSWLLVQEL
jgi:nucleoid DNA-binding protein